MRLLIGMALALAACSSQASESVAATHTAQPVTAEETHVHPISGLDIIPLTISQNGKSHEFKVEVARTDAQWTRGLMFREEMGEDEGMIFVGRPGYQASFWMRNTLIPLDIIFIGSDDRILNYHAKVPPLSLDPRPSAGPTNAVLEINGGRLEQLGFTPGAKVEWKD